MSEPVYTTIPDTSDSMYWELKSQNGQERSSTFVPRNKELHHHLKKMAREAKPVKRTYKDRHKNAD